MWEAKRTEDDQDAQSDDEDTRPTWPSSEPEMAPHSGRATWESCTTLAERMVRLVGGDTRRAIDVDSTIDRAIAAPRCSACCVDDRRPCA
jgi:hypothetical protein